MSKHTTTTTTTTATTKRGDKPAPMPTIATTDGRAVYTSADPAHPISLRSTPKRIADLCRACVRYGISQLWILDWPEGISAATLDGQSAAGWDLRPSSADPAYWTHAIMLHTDHEVDVICAPLDPDKDNPWQYARSAPDLLNALCWYRAVTGITWRRSSASTAANLLRQLHTGPHAKPLTLAGAMPAPALDGKTEAPIRWARPLTADELATCYWLHWYDKNAAFLGACSSLTVGVGEVEHVTDPAALVALIASGDACKLPGYYLVSLADTSSSPVIPAYTATHAAQREADRRQWLTTPTIRYLSERGQSFAAHDAYVWRTHHRPLAAWYKVIRAAREELMIARAHAEAGADDGTRAAAALALTAVKRTYAAFTSGYLASTKEGWDRSADPLFRPDIRHQIMATARVNLIRRADRAARDDGRLAVALGNVDTLYYVSPDPDPIRACPPSLTLGTTLRDVKVKGSAPLSPAILAALSADDPKLADPTKRLIALGNAIAETAQQHHHTTTTTTTTTKSA